MSPTELRLYSHPARPEWGRGLLVAERDKLLVIQWEDGKEHLVASSHREKLTVVEVPGDELPSLVERIKGLASSRPQASKAKAKKSRSGRPAAPTLTFDGQLAAFEKAYPGGFAGSPFIDAERGAATNPKEGTVQWAIGRAAEVLADAHFDDAEAIFAAIVALFRPPLGLVHPMEGAIPLKGMAAEVRPGFLSSLRALLHGSGDYAARFDAFVGATALVEKSGKVKRPGWPLVTLLPALSHPGEQLFVKPQLFQKQAGILGLRIDYSSQPSAAIYRQFLDVGRSLEAKLRDRGHAPRDLLDVSTYVWTTLSPNSAEAAVAPAPEEDDD